MKPECLAAQKAAADYQARYPNHCTTCQGWGGHNCPGDFVPYGSTSAQLPGSFEACPDCEEVNKCPRCGTLRVWHDEGNPAEVAENKKSGRKTESRLGYGLRCFGMWLTFRRMRRVRRIIYTDGWHEPCPKCGYVCLCCGLAGADEGKPEMECWCGFAEQLAEEEKFAAEMGKEPQLCPHGKQYHECNTCLEASDRAYDAARERRYLGR
jgi:hypothetical protein